ncbi:hypothetical protein [Vibrio europaeus]|uniref:hypothetical protein n=1 Tax=Vibrio europaeus TaxID=300876 RepID=UPI00148C4C4E|nr:hypothetical protein [Vibrio europaeus]NOH23861.1 hypothetical protein [Vibrio europaeus]
MKKLALLASLLIVLTGCQSTSGDSRFNPAVARTNVDKVAVFVANDFRTEKSIVERINKKGTQAIEVTRAIEFIKGEDKIQETLRGQGVTHLLMVKGTINEANTYYAGTITNSHMNFNSFGTGYGTASGSSYSIPTYGSNNYAHVVGELYDIEGELVWVTDVHLEAQGTMYTGQEAMSNGIAKGVVAEMAKSKLLAK